MSLGPIGEESPAFQRWQTVKLRPHGTGEIGFLLLEPSPPSPGCMEIGQVLLMSIGFLFSPYRKVSFPAIFVFE